LFIQGFPSVTRENTRRMMINKVAILLTLFIFGIIPRVWADSVKSINNSADQVKTMKIDENKALIEKKAKPARASTQPSKNRKGGFQSGIPYTNDGIIGNTRLDVNFLKTLEEDRNHQLRGSLDKAIYSNEFSQGVWRDKFLNLQEIGEFKSPASGSGQSNPKPYPNGNKNPDRGGMLATFKLLQSGREELFKEIFMGLRFSFSPMSRHMFLEMNVTPSSEGGPGIIIPF
jgi:hypothetical protein